MLGAGRIQLSWRPFFKIRLNPDEPLVLTRNRLGVTSRTLRDVSPPSVILYVASIGIAFNTRPSWS